MTLDGAVQVAAANCLNERTLDPTVCSYNRPTYVPASCTMAFIPQCSFRCSDLFFHVVIFYLLLLGALWRFI